MDAREIWFGRSVGAIVVRTLLIPLSLIYRFGWAIYLSFYRQGLKKSKVAHVPIVVVGNFTVGGSGKSPATVFIAKVIAELGFPVVVGCSGYGSPKSEGATLAPDGELHPAEWGDEPAMIRLLLPKVPIIVGRRRVLAAQICHERFPNAVLLMDDGLQHMPLKTQVQIALEEPDAPNRWTLPAGPYREPRSEARVTTILPGRFHVESSGLTFESPDGDQVPPDDLRDVSVITAIGRPDRFLRHLEDCGILSSNIQLLGDHDPMSKGTLLDSFDPVKPIILTLKDWVKVRTRPDAAQYRFVIARQHVTIEPADEFKAWLHEHIRKALDSKTDL